MSEHALFIIGVSLNASVFAMLLGQGAMVGPGDIARSLRDVRLLARTVLAAHVAVPLLTLLVAWGLRPQRNVVVALAILAACPVAPMLIVRLSKVGCRLAEVMALHLALTVVGLAVMPFTLHFMAQALDFRAEVNVAEVVRRLSWTLVVPLVGGIALRMLLPRVAAAVVKPLKQIAGVMLAALILMISGLMFEGILQTSARSYVAMTAVVAASLAAGHLIARRDPTEQLTLAMQSAGRHLGVALLIAATSFPSARALPVLIPYLLVFLAVSTVYVRWRRGAIAERRQCSDDADVPADINSVASGRPRPSGVSR